MALDPQDKARYLMFKGALSELSEESRAKIEEASERILAIMNEDAEIGGAAVSLAMFKALEKE
ncbi:hypothetical protein HV139_09420 [Citrobacter freundii]|nr:hypothetical protein [Citrobacter freundii]QLW74298.1 hypothetical protein HV139_09420 [Citrobacter freundii]